MPASTCWAPTSATRSACMSATRRAWCWRHCWFGRHRRAGRALWPCARVHKHGHVAELLFTFGLAYIIEELVQMVWGKIPVDYRVPELLNFSAFTLFSTTYPAFPACSCCACRWSLFIALLAAADPHPCRADHPCRVQPSQHGGRARPRRADGVHAGVWRGLAAWPALAGVIAGPALVTQPAMAASLGPILFVVVVVGGLGSLPGAFIASLLIGLIQTFAVAVNVSVADVLGGLGITLTRDSIDQATCGWPPWPRWRRSSRTCCWCWC